MADQIKRVIELGVSQVNINARDLGLALAALAQENARGRVAADTPAALTDNSTGTPSASSFVAVPLGVDAIHDGGSHCPKAGFDTAMGLVEDAHQELIDKANAFIALIAGSTYRTLADGAGATSDGTIAAIAAMTGATNNLVPRGDANAQIITARNNQASIISAINWALVALGHAPFPDNTGGTFQRTLAEWPITDAAATGTAVSTAGGETITLASANAALSALKNNIATASAIMNLARSAEIGPFVIATKNPDTRFTAGDFSLT